MHATPREYFLPRSQRRHAAADRPLPIGRGQTNSQPSTVRRMLELLDVHAGHRVLDVGSGSGWTTAILARLVGPTGRVIGVELEPKLAVWGRSNVAAVGLPWACVQTASDDDLGWPEEAPYQRILVSAQSAEVPAPLVAQLGDEGVMVLPVAGQLVRLRRRPDGAVETERFGHYRFVPLR